MPLLLISPIGSLHVCHSVEQAEELAEDFGPGTDVRAALGWRVWLEGDPWYMDETQEKCQHLWICYMRMARNWRHQDETRK